MSLQAPVAEAGERTAASLGEEAFTSMCGICPYSCGVNVYFKDGKLDHIRPLSLDVHPMGIICRRGEASRDIVYSPDRLLYPMKRVGARGEGRFERLSWDEALDDIAAAMLRIKERWGAQAMADYSGRGAFDQSLFDMFAVKGAPSGPIKNFLFPFGSPNTTGVNSVCYSSYGVMAPLVTYGGFAGFLRPDFEGTENLLIWGANPATDSPPIDMLPIGEARKRGARVTTIDHLDCFPREYRDAWVPIRPGTDGALALGMIHVVINERLYDEELVSKWTLGFEELRDYVQRFTPNEVERITKVPAQTIRQLARDLAAKPSCYILYTGLEYADSGLQNIRAALILFFLTGNFDAPGGMIYQNQGRLRVQRNPMAPPPDVPPIGADDYPAYVEYLKSAHFLSFPKAILEGKPYPIKGLIIDGASILTSYPEPKLWKRCFQALDLLVCIDRFPTNEAAFADYVLPATTYYEIDSYHTYGYYAQVRRKVIEPVGEARNDYLIFADLAKRLGYGDLYPQSEQEMLEFVFKDTSVSLDDLRAHPEGVGIPEPKPLYRKYETGRLRRDKQPGFDTASGKFEIVSSALRKHGYDGLPVYVEPRESPLSAPEMAKAYPLVFNSGTRIQSTFRTQHLNIPSLVSMQPQPEVFLHEEDARARGIVDGDLVEVVSPRGAVRFTARVTQGICRGAIEANFGGGGAKAAKAWRAANVNDLVPFAARDLISGFPVFKALLCEVRKAPAA